MKDFLLDLIKALFSALFSVLAAIMLVVVGALIAGYGLYRQWQWMVTAGVIVTAVGLAFIFHFWWSDD